MLRILPALAVLALALPATASAAPFGDLPFQALKGPAVCLRATGAPGELVRQTETTAPFLTAAPAGLTAGGVLPTDGAQDCVEVASWPGGGGVLAFPVYSEADGETWVRGFLREPGHDWGEPVDILPPGPRSGIELAVAASARGDALVATRTSDERRRQVVTVARRLPGGAFGAPERLDSRRANPEDPSAVRAGYSAAGEAVVVWTVRGPDEDARTELWAAVAPPGAAFGAPQRVGETDGGPYALAVGEDGRALAVFTSADRLVAAERAPGGQFAAPTTLVRPADTLRNSPAAVLRPGGGAVVAWTSPTIAGLTVRTREQAGRFGRAIDLVYPKRLRGDAMRIQQRFVLSGGGDLARAVATADGRVMVTWGHLAKRQGAWQVVPGVAQVNFAGDSYEVYGLTGSLRDIAEITPVVLADGSSAVAWSDNDRLGAGGRIRVARDGAPEAADPPAPRVTLTPPRSRALKDSDSLVLRVSCSAACDIDAQLEGRPPIAASVSLAKAGSDRLVFSPYDRPLVPRGGGKVRIVVRSSAPGARTVTVRTLSLTLRRAKILYPPRVLGLTLARDGDDLLVRWHTAKPARPRDYFVIAVDDQDETVGVGNPTGRARRTSFSVRIRKPTGAVRVDVYSIAENDDNKYRRTTVKVPPR
ncbi:hypothetical protein [Solirubrobacter soli]|uniref:hypothetical protein n=1 Tax=Solirubrobacter soli TaxID=363832 RepID=UPI0004193FF3|nr:hypothetical protein [Solirubrobacter soli]